MYTHVVMMMEVNSVTEHSQKPPMPPLTVLDHTKNSYKEELKLLHLVSLFSVAKVFTFG